MLVTTSDVEARFEKFYARFRLDPTNRRRALEIVKANPAAAEELMWLFRRRDSNSVFKLNCVFGSPPSLWPLMTLMINQWKAAKIRQRIENVWPKPVTFALPNQVVCAARKRRGLNTDGSYKHARQHDYEFEFTVKNQKIALIRGPDLIKQTIEGLVSNSIIVTAKAWHWRFEERGYPIDSEEGKTFQIMVEQNVTREMAALLRGGPRG